MRVRCTRGFRDLKDDIFRKEGDVFEVTEERYKEINTAGYGALAERLEEPEQEPAQEPEPESQGDEIAAEVTQRPSRRRSSRSKAE